MINLTEIQSVALTNKIFDIFHSIYLLDTSSNACGISDLLLEAYSFSLLVNIENKLTFDKMK